MGEEGHTEKGGKGTKPRQNWVNSKEEKGKRTEDKIPGPKERKQSLGEAYN